MTNIMLAVVFLLHSAPLAELCTFEELPEGDYSVTQIETEMVGTEKECMIACYNHPECTSADLLSDIDMCRLFKEGSTVQHIGPPTSTGFRLDRNLKRSNCPKLASLP